MSSISRAPLSLPCAAPVPRPAAALRPPLQAPRHVTRYHPNDGGQQQQQQQAPLLGQEQSFSLAFDVLDKDGDGLITQAEALRLVAFVNATQRTSTAAPRPAPLSAPGPGPACVTAPAAPAAAAPPHWDQHLAASIAEARASGGVLRALRAFLAGKLSGRLQRRPPRASDLLWSALGMAAAMGAIALLSAHAAALPVVGPLHQQGLPLMLGSFGTMAVLLFGRPEAEPVKLWPIVGGQLAAALTAIAFVKVFGTGILARAAAMGITMAAMMHIDAVHPPGGALVLLAFDNKAVQALEWGFLLWPSLLLTLCVALPIAAATNVLKRRVQFDWPGAAARAAPPEPGAAVGAAVAAAAAAPGRGAWGPDDAERWRAAVMAAPGADHGLGKRC